MPRYLVVCFFTGAVLVSSGSAFQRSHEWISVGGAYRVMSNVGSPTLCAYDMAYLGAMERLGSVITPPEHGDSPKRLQKVARLQREIAARARKGQTVLVPYNTAVKALAITPERDGHGIPKFVRVVALAGPLKGKPFWSRYGFVKTLAPSTNEPGVVRGSSAVWIPRLRSQMPEIAQKMRANDVAGLAALAASGEVAKVSPGTPVKVLSSTVAGVYLIETKVGGRRFKGWIERSRIAAR